MNDLPYDQPFPLDADAYRMARETLYAIAEQMPKALSEADRAQHLSTEEMAEEIRDYLRHATGVVAALAAVYHSEHGHAPSFDDLVVEGFSVTGRWN